MLIAAKYMKKNFWKKASRQIEKQTQKQIKQRFFNIGRQIKSKWCLKRKIFCAKLYFELQAKIKHCYNDLKYDWLTEWLTEWVTQWRTTMFTEELRSYFCQNRESISLIYFISIHMNIIIIRKFRVDTLVKWYILFTL